MYGLYSYPWGIQSSHRQPETPIYTVHSIIPVYLGGQPGTERVVVYTSSNTGLKSKVEIQRYDAAQRKWIVEYSKEAVGVPYFMVTTGYWELMKKNIVVLSYSEGSGGFLTYTVVGRNGNTLSELVNREGIFQGGVWLDGARLVESEGLRYKVWVRPNRRLTLEPFKVPSIPGAETITFSISNSAKVNIRQTRYSVSVGSVVQLIRTDLNPITERVLFSYTPVFQYIPHRNAFKITGPGSVQITIIPSGYDWDQAVDLTVEAK